MSLASAASWADTPSNRVNQTGKWVTGDYGGHFWENGTYQAPQHVDMTAAPHFVLASAAAAELAGSVTSLQVGPTLAAA